MQCNGKPSYDIDEWINPIKTSSITKETTRRNLQNVQSSIIALSLFITTICVTAIFVVVNLCIIP